mgnify:CR=1 FL=1
MMTLIAFSFLFACGEKETDTSTSEPASEDTNTTSVDDLSWVNPADLPAGNNACREPIRVLVEDVVDGDTFVGQGENGEERVRIIGVNTPETSSGDCYAQEAKSFLITQIFGRHVWLTFDSNCYDVYDRTLAYVHLGTNEQDFLERQILLGGYAKAFPFDDTNTFEDLFAADEATARENGAGGWSSCSW